MANTTDYTRLLDGYSLLAIKNYVDTAIGTRAPTSHASSATTYGVGTSSNYGHVKLGAADQNGATAANGVVAPNGHTHSQYLLSASETWRAIQVAGTTKIASSASTALNFLNGTHSVQFTYNSGLYAEVDLTKYKPDGSTAFLDSSNKVSTSYLPDTVLGQLEYMGTWNATTPDIILTPQKGHYYICTTAGNKNPAGGTVTGVSYAVGDWAVYNGSSWDKVDNTDAITSIKWGTGTAQTGAISIPYATGSVEGVIKLGTTSTTAAYGNHTHTLSLASSQATSGISYVYVNTVNRLTAGGSTLDLEIELSSYDITTILGYVPATDDHTHTTTIASSSGTSALTLAYGTKYQLTAGGTNFIFTMPSLGTTASTAAKGNHTHTTSLAAGGTSTISLSANTAYTLTAGGTTVVFKTPVDTTYSIAKYDTAGLLKPAYSNTTAVTLTTAAASVSNSVTVNARTTTSGKYYAVEIDKDGRLYVNVPWTDNNTNWYPTAFTWTNGTTAGPTGSLTGTGMSAVSFGAIPSASDSQSGVVTTGSQSFSGSKDFNNGVIRIGYTYPQQTTETNVILEVSNGHALLRGHLKVYSDYGSYPAVDPGISGTPDVDTEYHSTCIRISNYISGGANYCYPLSEGSGTFVLATRSWVGNNYATSGHSHILSIAADSGTNQLTLAYGTKYKLIAGGSNFIFTMPSLGTGSTQAAAGNHTHTITANATDGMFDLTGTNGTNAVTYALAPYSAATATSTWVGTASNYEKFYFGTTTPDNHWDSNKVLNFNGSFRSNYLIGRDVQVNGTLSFGDNAYAYYIPLYHHGYLGDWGYDLELGAHADNDRILIGWLHNQASTLPTSGQTFNRNIYALANQYIFTAYSGYNTEGAALGIEQGGSDLILKAGYNDSNSKCEELNCYTGMRFEANKFEFDQKGDTSASSRDATAYVTCQVPSSRPSGETEKYRMLNLFTYSQTEATNILNGKNSDGTNI